MSQSLQVLLQHAERQRDEAMAALLRAQAASRRLRQQWDQLCAYRAEYAARAPTLGGQVTSIERLRSHHGFMQRLDQALAQQQGLLVSSDAQVAQNQALLLQRETRVASVRKLQQRRLLEEQQQSSRREQTSSDEATLQRNWREGARHRATSH